MLGKLIKNDMKNIGKLLLPLNVIVLLMTLVGVALRASGLFDLDNTSSLLAILIMAYSMGMIVIMVVSYFYPIIHYYRNLFSRQGYLTFTLPVSSWSILFSKTLVGFFWYMVTGVVATFSVWAVTGFYRIPRETIAYVNYYFAQELGMNLATFMGWMVVIAISALLWTLMTAYFSITVGQLYAKHKIIASVVVYVAVYTVMQVLITIALIPFIFRSPTQETIVSVALYSTVVFSLIFSPIFYGISGIILKKKVNLD